MVFCREKVFYTPHLIPMYSPIGQIVLRITRSQFLLLCPALSHLWVITGVLILCQMRQFFPQQGSHAGHPAWKNSIFICRYATQCVQLKSYCLFVIFGFRFLFDSREQYLSDVCHFFQLFRRCVWQDCYLIYRFQCARKKPPYVWAYSVANSRKLCTIRFSSRLLI